MPPAVASIQRASSGTGSSGEAVVRRRSSVVERRSGPGEDRDARPAPAGRVHGLVAGRLQLQLGERVGVGLGLLQADDVGPVLLEQFQHPRHPHLQRVDVPGDDAHRHKTGTNSFAAVEIRAPRWVDGRSLDENGRRGRSKLPSFGWRGRGPRQGRITTAQLLRLGVGAGDDRRLDSRRIPLPAAARRVRGRQPRPDGRVRPVGGRPVRRPGSDALARDGCVVA